MLARRSEQNPTDKTRLQLIQLLSWIPAIILGYSRTLSSSGPTHSLPSLHSDKYNRCTWS